MANPRCKRCQRGEPHEFTHGRSGYNFHACRCDVCTTDAVDAAVDRARRLRAADPTWAQSQRDYMREYYARTKESQRGRRNESTKKRRRLYGDDLNAQDRRRRQVDHEWRSRRARQLRESRQRHPERTRDQSARDRDKRRDQACVEMREWRERNAGYISEYQREYQQRKSSAVIVSRTRVDRWTPTEDQIAATPGITPMEVARLTGRSWHASRRRVAMFRNWSAS